MDLQGKENFVCARVCVRVCAGEGKGSAEERVWRGTNMYDVDEGVEGAAMRQGPLGFEVGGEDGGKVIIEQSRRKGGVAAATTAAKIKRKRKRK